MTKQKQGHILCGLDGTLARYETWNGLEHIGLPVPKMLERVRKWLAEGRKVKCFTARATTPEGIPPVRKWLDKLGLQAVEVTNVKDYQMAEVWDDRAIGVISNTGMPAHILAQAQLKRLLDAVGIPVAHGQSFDTAVDAALRSVTPKLRGLATLKAYLEGIADALGYEVRNNPKVSDDVRRAFTTVTKAQNLLP